MAFRVVLDACVLYPFSLRDTLLRLAERELYDVFWSDRILHEVTRNIVNNGVTTQAQANRLVQIMNLAFESAVVPAAAVDQLEPAMTNHPKDRHVLAAAVAAHAQVIVTSNLKDFPPSACEAVGVEAIHPDEFLQNLCIQNPRVVLATLEQQAKDLTNPPMTLADLVAALAKTVPGFALAIQD